MKKIISILLLFYSIANFSQNNEKQEDTNVYDIKGIEVRPEFLGGTEKLNAYINEGLLKAGFETLPKEKTRTVNVNEPYTYRQVIVSTYFFIKSSLISSCFGVEKVKARFSGMTSLSATMLTSTPLLTSAFTVST